MPKEIQVMSQSLQNLCRHIGAGLGVKAIRNYSVYIKASLNIFDIKKSLKVVQDNQRIFECSNYQKKY